MKTFVLNLLAIVCLFGCARVDPRNETTITPDQPTTIPSSSSTDTQVHQETGSVVTTFDLQKFAEEFRLSLLDTLNANIKASLGEFNTTLNNELNARIDSRVNATVTAAVEAQVSSIRKQDSHDQDSAGGDQLKGGSAQSKGDHSPVITLQGSGAYLFGGLVVVAVVIVMLNRSKNQYKRALNGVINMMPNTDDALEAFNEQTPEGKLVAKMVARNRK